MRLSHACTAMHARHTAQATSYTCAIQDAETLETVQKCLGENPPAAAPDAAASAAGGPQDALRYSMSREAALILTTSGYCVR